MLRQNAPGSAHRDTEVIYLRMPPVVTGETIFTSLVTVDYAPMPHPVLGKLLDDVASLVGGKLARCMLVKLKRHGVVRAHIDQGVYAEATDRYHVALVTNPGCLMFIGTEFHHSKPGEVCFFDKHAMHGVFNGADDRLHLIIDFWRNAPEGLTAV